VAGRAGCLYRRLGGGISSNDQLASNGQLISTASVSMTGGWRLCMKGAKPDSS